MLGTRKRMGLVGVAMGVLVSLSLADCGSRLKYIKKQNKGTGGGERVDLEALKFIDVVTDAEITAQEYMRANNVRYLLLTFGSIGCAACNEEAKDYSLNYEGKHELLLNKKDKQFDFVGVNTDSGSAQSRFKSIMLSENERRSYGYNFIRWADPRGEIMVRHLIESDRQFSIPFSIFLRNDEIMWRIYNDEHADMESILARADATIKGEDFQKRATPTPTPVVIDQNIRNYLLGLERADRFSVVEVKNCKGETKNLQQVVAEKRINIFTLTQANCEAGSDASACHSIHQSVNASTESCRTAGTCQTLVLKTNADVTESECKIYDGRIYSGGSEFFQKFSSHFNWRLPKYLPSKDAIGIPQGIPNIGGTVVLGFSTGGQLIFSWDGAGGSDLQTSLARSLQSESLAPERLPDFPVYGKSFTANDVGDKNLAQIVRQSKYTVLALLGHMCTGCVDEVSEWSKAGGIYEFCNGRPDFCQAYVVEMQFPEDYFLSDKVALYHKVVKEEFSGKHGSIERDVKFPLLVDTGVFRFGPDEDPFPRLHASYLKPLLKWQTNGQVIYDREGKLVKSFEISDATIDNALLKTLKLLWEHRN